MSQGTERPISHTESEISFGNLPFSFTKSCDTRPDDPEVEAWHDEGTNLAGEILSPVQLNVLTELIRRKGISKPISFEADISHRYDEFGWLTSRGVFSATVMIRCIDEQQEHHLLIHKRTKDEEDYYRWKEPDGWIEEIDLLTEEEKAAWKAAQPKEDPIKTLADEMGWDYEKTKAMLEEVRLVWEERWRQAFRMVAEMAEKREGKQG